MMLISIDCSSLNCLHKMETMPCCLAVVIAVHRMPTKSSHIPKTFHVICEFINLRVILLEINIQDNGTKYLGVSALVVFNHRRPTLRRNLVIFNLQVDATKHNSFVSYMSTTNYTQSTGLNRSKRRLYITEKCEHCIWLAYENWIGVRWRPPVAGSRPSTPS